MFHNLAEDIAFILIKNKVIDIEERDIYIYGLEIILLNGILLFIFFLLGDIRHFFAYILFFVPLRIFSGGYHANKSEHCFVLSILAYCISIAVVTFFPMLYRMWLWRIAGILSILIVVTYAPLVNINNPLSESQKKRNKIIVRLLMIPDLVFFIVFCRIKCNIASNEILFVCLNSVMLLFGKINMKWEEKNAKDMLE